MIEIAVLLVLTYDDYVRAGLRAFMSKIKTGINNAQLTTISVTISVASNHSK